MASLKKVVIPAAGLGTRFLPQTKAMPKEMLPIIDKPVIQYVVEEAVAAGLKDIVIITGLSKRAIEDHFDRNKELENHLKEKGKTEELDLCLKISSLANFIYIRQREGYGNAIPVLCAKPVIEEDFFVVMWGDEFIYAEPPRLTQMIAAFEKYQTAIISAVRIESEDNLSRYGIADIEKVADNLYQIKKIVEKPMPAVAPSNLATHGAYILPFKIFEVIEKLEPGRDGELWLIDAINKLIETGFPFYALEIQNARYYDTGNKIEYLKTVIDFALSHPKIGPELKKYLKSLKL